MDYFVKIINSWQPFVANGLLALLQSVFILIIGWWIINNICKLGLVFFQKTVSDSGITSFLYSLMKFFLRTILVLTAVSNLGINVNSIFTAIGASLVAVGISLKDNLSNLMSGIILVVNKPIHIGDYIEVDGCKGSVVKIEMLFTTLQTEDKNKTIIIPNSKLVATSITRQSEYDMSVVEKTYKSNVCVKRHKELKRYFEKEFILNNKILQIPTPVIDIEISDNETLLSFKIYTQNQYCDALKDDIENSVNKASRKYGVKFSESVKQ